MLSYVHAFHAGGAADVLKHAVLAQTLALLSEKPKPMTVLDLNAGSGIYSLADERSARTAEAEGGILRLLSSLGILPESARKFLPADFSPPDEGKTLGADDDGRLLSAYTGAVLPFVERGEYPGSPAVEAAFLRDGDEHILCELHPQAAAELKAAAARFSRRPHVHKRDCWEFAVAATPPKIRRGLAILDPSFEDADEWEKCAEAVEAVRRRWGAATVAVWYPVLPHRTRELAELRRRTSAAAPGSTLDAEIRTAAFDEMTGNASLCGSGMLVANAPWKLAESLEKIVPALSRHLGAKSWTLSRT